MKFIDLRADGSNMVFMGLEVPEGKEAELIEEMNKVFTEEGLLLDDNKVVSIELIEGNIVNSGRTDWVLNLSKDVVNVDPLKRLMWSSSGIKWTDDYIQNYASEFGYCADEFETEISDNN